MDMEMDDPRAARAAQRAEVREQHFEEQATEKAEADAKWEWYEKSRADFTAEFGTSDRYTTAPHCSRCQRLCRCRISALKLCGPQPERVGNEDPPQLVWEFPSACEHCIRDVLTGKKFGKTVKTDYTADNVKRLLDLNLIKGNLQTYLIMCWREGMPHVVLSQWLWQGCLNTACHPFAE